MLLLTLLFLTNIINTVLLLTINFNIVLFLTIIINIVLFLTIIIDIMLYLSSVRWKTWWQRMLQKPKSREKSVNIICLLPTILAKVWSHLLLITV